MNLNLTMQIELSTATDCRGLDTNLANVLNQASSDLVNKPIGIGEWQYCRPYGRYRLHDIDFELLLVDNGDVPAEVIESLDKKIKAHWPKIEESLKRP